MTDINTFARPFTVLVRHAFFVRGWTASQHPGCVCARHIVCEVMQCKWRSGTAVLKLQAAVLQHLVRVHDVVTQRCLWPLASESEPLVLAVVFTALRQSCSGKSSRYPLCTCCIAAGRLTIVTSQRIVKSVLVAANHLSRSIPLVQQAAAIAASAKPGRCPPAV